MTERKTGGRANRWVAALLLLGASGVVPFLAGVNSTPASPATRFLPAPTQAAEPIRPIPETLQLNPRQVALGRRLFSDPMLSRDRSISCASCHVLEQGGSDGRARSVGLGGAVGGVNAPTVFNSVFNFAQFWDGRADSLQAQVDGPLLAAAEMGSNWNDVVARLRAAPAYVQAFGAAFADGVTPANVRKAIAEFERSLITPNSRFDRYLRGDHAALSDAELSGYRKFKSYGCVSCHQGVNVGGNMFQRMGVMGDYFGERGSITEADYGRFNFTGDEADRYLFKVPGLRNVERTAPYFHDGSARTLEDAVAVMARYQLGRELPRADLVELVLFLKTLTGEPPRSLAP